MIMLDFNNGKLELILRQPQECTIGYSGKITEFKSKVLPILQKKIKSVKRCKNIDDYDVYLMSLRNIFDSIESVCNFKRENIKFVDEKNQPFHFIISYSYDDKDF